LYQEVILEVPLSPCLLSRIRERRGYSLAAIVDVGVILEAFTLNLMAVRWSVGTIKVSCYCLGVEYAGTLFHGFYFLRRKYKPIMMTGIQNKRPKFPESASAIAVPAIATFAAFAAAALAASPLIMTKSVIKTRLVPSHCKNYYSEKSAPQAFQAS